MILQQRFSEVQIKKSICGDFTNLRTPSGHLVNIPRKVAHILILLSISNVLDKSDEKLLFFYSSSKKHL